MFAAGQSPGYENGITRKYAATKGAAGEIPISATAQPPRRRKGEGCAVDSRLKKYKSGEKGYLQKSLTPKMRYNVSLVEKAQNCAAGDLGLL